MKILIHLAFLVLIMAGVSYAQSSAGPVKLEPGQSVSIEAVYADSDADGFPDPIANADACPAQAAPGTTDGCPAPDPEPEPEPTPEPTPTGHGADCQGVNVSPSENIVAVAANHPSGTTFCVQDGSHPITQPVLVQSGDRFIGVYSDTTRPNIHTTTSPYIFDASGSNGAFIANVTVKGATGENTGAPYPGRGVHQGSNLTLDNIRATGNKNNGVGGAGDGLLVRNSEIDNNGHPEFYNDPDGHPVDSAGIKSVNSFKVVNSYIHDNEWVGVWCDLECGDGPGGSTEPQFEVRDNRIENNGGRGIFYEISYGPAIIEGNTITGNGAVAKSIGRQYAGLLVNGSQQLDAYGNTFGNNVDYGFRAVEDSRIPDLADVKFHDNTMNGDPADGCSRTGVSCTNNTP
jgi:hypothetical protein